MKKLFKAGVIIGTLGTLTVMLVVHGVWRFVRDLDAEANDVSDWWDGTFQDYNWDDDYDDWG